MFALDRRGRDAFTHSSEGAHRRTSSKTRANIPNMLKTHGVSLRDLRRTLGGSGPEGPFGLRRGLSGLKAAAPSRGSRTVFRMDGADCLGLLRARCGKFSCECAVCSAPLARRTIHLVAPDLGERLNEPVAPEDRALSLGDRHVGPVQDYSRIGSCLLRFQDA